MRQSLNEERIAQVLRDRDPLGSWINEPVSSDEYVAIAELALADLGRIQGVGHIWTVLADAIDRRHAGFYAFVRQDEGETRQLVSMAARDLWDGLQIGGQTRTDAASAERLVEEGLPDAPDVRDLAASPGLVEPWLRTIERRLTDEPWRPDFPLGPARRALEQILPDLVDVYWDAGDGWRVEVRLAFSRFRLVLHALSGFVSHQSRLAAGKSWALAARRCLAAESLLDMGSDWRDELLVLQDLRRRSGEAGEPFEIMVEAAARRSSEGTAQFLRGLIGVSETGPETRRSR